MKKIILMLIPLFAALMNSCYYDNEESLNANSGNQVLCDTANITYSGKIESVLSTYCYSCHAATYLTDGKGKKYNTYQDVKSNIDIIIGAIDHDPKYAAMPKGAAKLNKCIVLQLQTWKNNGMIQ
ncbi:MAG: hypothetical protein QG635_2332 [Bacteroidota bacterium]|nr:hypothetical protein [Bacteroidota bacterium]